MSEGEDFYDDKEADSQPTIIEKREEKLNETVQSMVTQDGYIDPYINRSMQSQDAQVINRLLTIQMPKTDVEKSKLWISESAFLEQLGLINLTKAEQKSLISIYRDIEALAQGEGNEEIVISEQRILALHIISYKSRSDMKDTGYRERVLLTTTNQRSDQTIRMPESEGNKKGWIRGLLGGGK